MDLFDDLEFEKEKQRLLKTYNCKTLKEVIEFLERQIKIQNKEKSRQKDKL